MKVFVKGKGEVSLSQKDFVASGGEGSVYSKGGLAYKIYADPTKMIPGGKIQELSALTDSHIIKPEEIILDSKNSIIGYTMKYVDNTYSLCQLFTKTFRDRNNVTTDMTLALVRQLQGLVQHVHSNKILIVDLNEMNFLASKKLDNLFAIDVDSYQTKSFPATAIMESIRDRHSKTFNENTDWFSFGIVAFQMFIGIHPYKGKHPLIKSWEERMQKNVSVLNKDVSVPSACLPFTVMPDVYKQWFNAVFDGGKRVPPPFDLHAAVQLVHTIKKIVGSDNFDIQEFDSLTGNILDVIFHGGLKIILTSDGLHINRSKVPVGQNVTLTVTPRSNSVIVASTERSQLKLYDATRSRDLPVNIAATDIMKYGGRIYIKSLSNVLELQLNEMGDNILPTFKIVGQILEKATDFFDGVVIQNLLGSQYVSLFPSSGACCQIRIKELDNHKIVNAKFDSGILMVVAANKGKYNKFIFKFDKIPNDNYELRTINDIAYSGLNFVVLDSGVCVHLTDDEDIEIFRADIGSSSIKVIDDVAITNDMLLFKNGVKLMAAKDNKLYSMTMKSKP